MREGKGMGREGNGKGRREREEGRKGKERGGEERTGERPYTSSWLRHCPAPNYSGLVMMIMMNLHYGPQARCHYILDYNFHVS